MASKQKKRPIIEYDDFTFFVIYERYGGYGNHEKREIVRRSVEDLRVQHVRGGRPRQTEWYPISKSCNCGVASVKYVAVLTFDGLKELVSNAMLYDYSKTMGAINESGHLVPAISLDSGCYDDYSSHTVDEAELRRRFKSNYERAIYDCQNYSRVNCHVSFGVDEVRLNDAILSVFNKPYRELSDEQRMFVMPKIEKHNQLCELMNGYIKRLADDERDVEPDKSQFFIDFRELQIDF